MFRDTLFKNRDEAIKAGNELRLTPNHFVIPDLVDSLVNITHEKLQNIHHNLKLYETFIDAYYDKIEKHDN